MTLSIISKASRSSVGSDEEEGGGGKKRTGNRLLLPKELLASYLNTVSLTYVDRSLLQVDF